MPVQQPTGSASADSTRDNQGTDALPSVTIRWNLDIASLSPARYLFTVSLVALVYFAGARLGLQLASFHPSASPVWPATGISFAAVLLLGYRVWPGILAGAFLANLITAGTFFTSSGIAIGNTAEALLGVYLVRKFAGGLLVFHRTESIFKFLILTAGLSTAVSATTGVLVLSAAGLADWGDFRTIWLTWWLGDVMGSIIVAPVIVLWSVYPPSRPSRPMMLEAFILVLCLTAVGLTAFGSGRMGSPYRFAAIPFLLWAAFRFGRAEASTAVLLLAVIAAWTTFHDTGFVSESDANLLVLQAFIGVTGIMTLAVAGVVSERKDATEALRHARDELAMKVKITGEALGGVEEQLRREATLLSRAEQISHAGSFQWDMASNRVVWSDELHRIYRRTRDEFPGTIEAFMSYVHPEDRDHVRAVVEGAIRERQPFRMRERIVRPDGDVRVLNSVGDVIVDKAGTVVGLCGVCRDFTERDLSEERFETLLESAPDAIVIVDSNGSIFMVNAQTERLFGYRKEELLGKPVEVLVPTRFGGKHAEHRKHYLANPHTRPMGPDLDLYGQRKDGSEFPVEISLSPLRTDQGTLTTAAIRDVSERRRVEESLRQLSGRLLSLQDAEQQRVARELQAGVSQMLESLRSQLLVIRNSGTVFDWKTADALHQCTALVQDLTKEIRTLSHLLYPRLLDEAGLPEALRWYQGSFMQRTGIKVSLDIPPSLGRFSQNVERTLFRIVQESLTNIHRHSGAKYAKIRLSEDAYAITLMIQDNGGGIPVGAKETSADTGTQFGVGIPGMIERMKQLGGRLEIDSGTLGTTVHALLPVSLARRIQT